jgi:DNA mismatch repair protein MutS
LEVKRQHPDAVLLFRLGDFYEAFDQDAVLISRELELTLTTRDLGKGAKVPMAGIPSHVVDSYIAKLVRRGYKVAVCEQVGPSQNRNLMDRRVERVVTPGTALEAGLLSERENNLLAAARWEGQQWALVYLDASTGLFRATSGRGEPERLCEEISRLFPRELLVLARAEGHLSDWFSSLRDLSIHITPLDAWHWEPAAAAEKLKTLLGVVTLEGFGLDDRLVLSAAGACLSYLEMTRPSALTGIRQLEYIPSSQWMHLDRNVLQHLEVFPVGDNSKPSLLGVLDLTRTPMGARTLRSWLARPLLEKSKIDERLDRIQFFLDRPKLRTMVLEMLRKIPDIERIVNRCLQASAGPRDLLGLAAGLREIEVLQPALEAEGYAESALFHSLPQLAAELEAAIDLNHPESSCFVRRGYSQELDELVKLASGGRQWIADLEARERERTGIRSLRVGYNRVFGYYIEVTRPHLHLVPPHYHRRQTLTGAERFVTPELKEMETRILTAQERAEQIQAEILDDLRRRVAVETERLRITSAALARLDVAVALAEVAAIRRYVRPHITDTSTIRLRQARHPIVEAFVTERAFIPNDVYINSEDAQILVVTGPNMAGKSTYLRMIGLIALMAQAGCFVPAEQAEIGLVDRLFTRIGAHDNLAAGQSTFLVEMVETTRALTGATSRSLILLDEVGRGTSTYDGLAIAQAVIEYLHNHPSARARTVFATHYHELTTLAQRLPLVKNLRTEVYEEGDQVTFLYRVSPGAADRSYGIHVARMAGMPSQVVHRAEEILQELEAARSPHPARSSEVQTSFLPVLDPILEELASLDVLSMTPLDALNLLYGLVLRARAHTGNRAGPKKSQKAHRART